MSSKVYTGATMSLDGYIAGPGESGFEYLFTWYGSGDVEVPTSDPKLTMRMSEVDAQHFRDLIEMSGALVVGRKLFDVTDGWGGIEAAIGKAKELAGDKVVGVNGGTIARQALNAGLLDEIWVDLVPVLLGGGTPFFDELVGVPIELDGPVSVVQGTGVTHLRYRVRR